MATIQVKIVDVSGQIPYTDTALNSPLESDSSHLIQDAPTAVSNEVTIQTSNIDVVVTENQRDVNDGSVETNLKYNVEDANTIPCKDVSTPFDDLHGQIARGNASWWGLSKDWKSTHVFTGKNIIFPIEMFIAVMEQKYTFTDDKSNLIADTLNRIPEPEQNSLEVLNMPSTLWKHQNMKYLMTLDWDEFKDELLKQFGQKQKYDSRQRALFLQSIQRGQRERMDTFLVRINIIVNIIQNGEANHHLVAEETWLKILLLAGLDEESRKLLPENTDSLSPNAICNCLAKRNEKLYFEGQPFSEHLPLEYDNLFTKNALGWGNEGDIHVAEEEWLDEEVSGENEVICWKDDKEALTLEEHTQRNVRQSRRLKLKRKSNSVKIVGGRRLKRSKTDEKTEEELEDSKQKAMESNMFSCEKCGEIFDSVSL